MLEDSAIITTALIGCY